MLCQACSEGRPHRDHDHLGESGWQVDRRLGFAGPPAQVRSLLSDWSAGGASRAVAADLRVF
jgi:hypothetical protein